MRHPRRHAGALLIALLVLSAAGCAPGEPVPSCGAFTLDRGESIPREALDCMAEADEDDTLKVTTLNREGVPIVTTYATAVEGGIVMNVEFGGGTSIYLCPAADSVADLGECGELHEGH